jgi:hypothetical protein
MMSNIVRLNSEGRSQFPTYARLFGEIVGTKADGLKLVQFQGKPAHIELHPDFLESAKMPHCAVKRPPHRKNLQSTIASRRKMLRRAYEIIRNSLDNRRLFSAIGHGLGGSWPITTDLMDDAADILRSTGATSDAVLIDSGMQAHLDLEAHDVIYQPRS